MKVLFGEHARQNDKVKQLVEKFLTEADTLEGRYNMPVVICQDGVNNSYYIKCSILAKSASDLCDLNARLDVTSTESYRANRQLLLKNLTYLKMETDAAKGREFNDIIVEYNTDYNPKQPLKVWGGQHRTSAIYKSGRDKKRHHGFRVFFALSKDQRTELALTSNTNIAVSNDLFDRMMEETRFGDTLLNWCYKSALLQKGENFPDVGSRSEAITVKKARSFIVNFYLGKERGKSISADDLDRNVYEPHLAATGITFDPQYEKVMAENDILNDEMLVRAGQRFAALHHAQVKSITAGGTKINKKGFRNKAFVESVLCGWSYVAGLLQTHHKRLENHYKVPRTTSKVPDPLNAKEMSEFKHDSDLATYRGLGTRSAVKDRQRMAQLFLAKSRQDNVAIDKAFMNRAVSQVIGLVTLAKGYVNK